MKLKQEIIDLAIRYYDSGMGMQQAVDKAIKFYRVKDNRSNMVISKGE